MNNDQEWDDEKQEHWNEILYKCFLDGYCARASITLQWEEEKYTYTVKDYTSRKFVNQIVEQGSDAAHDYIKSREGEE